MRPLNQPSSGHILADAPNLAQRSHQMPLYKPAAANKTICEGMRCVEQQDCSFGQKGREFIYDNG
jgi:hypothetical protein